MLLAYPDEGHGLRGMANRKDLTIRFFEFFDHYLKGAPAPKWMTDGVPYLKKEAAPRPGAVGGGLRLGSVTRPGLKPRPYVHGVRRGRASARPGPGARCT